MGSKLYRVAVDGHSAGAGVEPDAPAIELAFCMTRGAAQKRANSRQDLLEVVAGSRFANDQFEKLLPYVF